MIMKKPIAIFGIIAAIIVALFVFLPTGGADNADTIKVGAILPLTGPIAYLGEGESLGIRLASEQQTADAARQVEFVFEDSQGKANSAISAARKLLDMQGIPIHAVFTTTPVLATLPVYERAERDIMVITQCMVPGVTQGYPFAYRLYATSDEETDLLADYAKDKDLKRFAGIHINNRFGEEGVNFFKKKIEAFGGEMVLQDQFSFADKDFRNLLTKIKRLNVDGIIIYAYSTTFPVIFQQMQELGMEDMPVLGNLDLALGGLEEKVDPDFLENVIFPAPRYYFEDDNPNTITFNEKVRASGNQPTIDIAYAYDMASILIAAINEAETTKPDDVEAALLKLMPYEGATGTITLTEDRDTRAAMKLVKWVDGEINLAQ